MKHSHFASWKLDHAAIRVPDFESAVAWYAEKLDFQLRQTLSLAGLTFGLLYLASDDSFHFELLAGPDAEKRPSYEGLHDSYGLYGWHHMGLHVANVDATIGELERRGVQIVSAPQDLHQMGLRVAFFADPWGNLFEVVQPLDGHPSSS